MRRSKIIIAALRSGYRVTIYPRSCNTTFNSTEHWTRAMQHCLPVNRNNTLLVKKTIRYNIAHNFAKCWPIFKFFSLTDSLVNMPQNGR